MEKKTYTDHLVSITFERVRSIAAELREHPIVASASNVPEDLLDASEKLGGLTPVTKEEKIIMSTLRYLYDRNPKAFRTFAFILRQTSLLLCVGPQEYGSALGVDIETDSRGKIVGVSPADLPAATSEGNRGRRINPRGDRPPRRYDSRKSARDKIRLNGRPGRYDSQFANQTEDAPDFLRRSPQSVAVMDSATYASVLQSFESKANIRSPAEGPDEGRVVSVSSADFGVVEPGVRWADVPMSTEQDEDD
mgnify:CR=1 FL=1